MSPPTKSKITGTSNHLSLISLNINGLKSLIKGYKNIIYSSAAYKKHISTSKTDIASE